MEIRFTQIVYGLFASLFLLAGCETSLDFHLHPVPKLTIVSHLSPESWEGRRVHVYATQSAADSSVFYTPDNLVVNVTEVESQVTLKLDSTSSEGKTYFVFPEGFIKSGFTYSITAFAPGFDIVEAITEIPEPSTISSMSVEDVRIEPSSAHEFKKIIHYKVVLNIDHYKTNRYYHLVFSNSYVGLGNTRFILNPEPSDNQPYLSHYDYGVLLDKNDLEEGEPVVFEFKDWVVTGNELNKVYAELRTITEDYYKYHSTLARQLIVRQDPFAEPVIIFNNIDGGYGNFSGYNPKTSSSDLPN